MFKKKKSLEKIVIGGESVYVTEVAGIWIQILLSHTAFR